MASIRADVEIAAGCGDVWDAVRDVGAVHLRLAPGFVSRVEMEGEARIVTFANGLVVRERIIDVDDANRRLSYSATGGRAEHHNASIEVRPAGCGRCRMIWITDVLPHSAAVPIGAMVRQGIEVIRTAMETARAPTFGSGTRD